MGFAWREQLSVGNDVIDTDHKYLVDLINRVEEVLKTKNKTALPEVLESLSKYALVHFAREEKIAQAAGYVSVPQLSQSHELLTKQLEEVKQEMLLVQEDWSSAAIDHFVRLIRRWLIDHVIKEDLLMKSTLKQFSPRFDPR